MTYSVERIQMVVRRTSSSTAAAALIVLIAGAGCAGPEKTADRPRAGTTETLARPTSGSSVSSASAPGAATRPVDDKANKFDDTVAVAALRERALGFLTEVATGGAPEVRVNAIEALSGSPRRVEPIVRAALVDPIPALRIAGAAVIGNTKMESSASFVEPLLNDPVLPVRAAAAYALKRCGRNVDMEPLATLLADNSPRGRAQAAYLLGKLGDRSALPMLEDAVRDTIPRASGSELRLMELQVAEARVRLGDEEAIHSIRAALFPARSEDLEATALAAQLMGELNDRASTRELVMLTQMRDDAGNMMPPEVRLAAAGSLATLRIEQASPGAVATEFLGNAAAPIRAQAAFVLGQCGRRQDLAQLEPLMDDVSVQVRVTAAAAITRLSGERGASAGAMR